MRTRAAQWDSFLSFLMLETKAGAELLLLQGLLNQQQLSSWIPAINPQLHVVNHQDVNHSFPQYEMTSRFLLSVPRDCGCGSPPPACVMVGSAVACTDTAVAVPSLTVAAGK